MNLYCGSFPQFLRPCPVPEAFQRTQELLLSLRDQGGDELPSALQSSLLKEQFFLQFSGLRQTLVESIRLWSRQSILAGLLCGALDGAGLYLGDRAPEDFQVPAHLTRLADELDAVVEVADTYWRGLDVDSLHEQCLYGKEENWNSDEENVRVLAGTDSPKRLQHVLWETFRTAYGIGLIEAAVVCLYGEWSQLTPSSAHSALNSQTDR